MDSTLDTHEDAQAHSNKPVPVRPYLFAVLECDRPSAGGARYALDGVDHVKIGRGPRREALGGSAARGGLRITIPGRSVSSRHADIRLVDGTWLLEDQGSTNGTFVNGKKVESCELVDGDLLEIGHSFFVLSLAVPTPARTETEHDPALVHHADPFATLLPWLDAAFRRTQAAAVTPLTVLVVGQSGTGKELVARAVHALSGRQGELTAVNCAALAPTLVESLLFGHVKGAFSGAVRDEAGFIRAAHRGTLLLDEIAELPMNVQAMLLRAIQEREVVPVGAARPLPVDVRIVAASQVPLDELVAKGRMRADLYARLYGYELRLPTLAERRVDIGMLVRAFLARMGGEPITLSREVGQALLTHAWPQNIRELEQALRHAVALCDGAQAHLKDLPAAVAGGTTSSMPPAKKRAAADTLSESDKKIKDELVRLLKEHKGNVSGVARAMGKARMQIQRWVRRFEIETGEYR